MILLYITLIIGVFPIIIYSLNYKRNTSINYFLPFIFVTALASIYEYLGTYILKINTSFWFLIYLLIEFLSVYYFFYKTLKQNRLKLLYFFLILFTCLFIFSLLYWSKSNSLITQGINSVFITVFVFVSTFLWFKDVFGDLEIPVLWRNPKFQFIAGFLLYYSSTLFLYISSNFIFENKNLIFSDYWFLNILATFIFRMILILATWNQLRK